MWVIKSVTELFGNLLFSFSHRFCNHHLLLFLSLYPIGDSDFAAAIKEFCSPTFKPIILYTNNIGVIFVDFVVQKCQRLRTIWTSLGVVQVQADSRTASLVAIEGSAGFLV